MMPSLPTRERGLKSAGSLRYAIAARSLPTRERGLKFLNHDLQIVTTSRSPRGSVG